MYIGQQQTCSYLAEALIRPCITCMHTCEYVPVLLVGVCVILSMLLRLNTFRLSLFRMLDGLTICVERHSDLDLCCKAAAYGKRVYRYCLRTLRDKASLLGGVLVFSS